MWMHQRKIVFLLAALMLFALSSQNACTGPEGEQVTETTTEKADEEKKTEEKGEEAKDEPKAEANDEPKPEPQDEPKPEPQDEPKPEPKPEPRPEPAPEKEAVADASEPIVETPKEEIPEPRGPEPTVSITKPADGDFVKGLITIEVDATVAAGPVIDRVELLIDGKKVDVTSTSPYSFSYDTKALKDGEHTIAAVAYTDWLKSKKAEIKVKSANFGPTITFVKPGVNPSVTAKFDIEVTVTDNIGLKTGGVELYINGAKVAWTSTNPYKVSYDPTSLPYDSFPIEVKAENTQGVKSSLIKWMIFDPPAGPKKSGEECDETDPTKRCAANHSCLLIGGQGSKKTCYLNCFIGGLPGQCPPITGKKVQCIVSWQGTVRGTCQAFEPAPGSLYSKCGGGQACNDSNHVCVGATTGGTSYCLKKCSGSGATCPDPGYLCVPLSSGGGACIEKCQSSCKTTADCATGQTCKSGTCAGTACGNYGSCTSLSGLSDKICI